MEIASHVESCTLPLVLTNDDGNLINIEIRPDGYVNATKLCQSVGKLWQHYNSNAKTKEFLVELSKVEKIPVVNLLVGNPTSSFPPRCLVELGSNQHQNTWVHPDVAIHLAQWASPRFGVAVSRLVRRYQTGQVTTQESINASVDLAQNVSVVDDGRRQAVKIVSGSVATRQPPRFQLKSAGFNNPADLQKPLMYFIAPGPLLIPTNEPTVVKSLITNDLIEKDDPPPYQQHDFDIVKFGISSNAMQRKRTHDNDFGVCRILDWILCDNTEELEKMAKCWFVAMNRLISAKSAKKNSQDTELVRPTTQEEYTYIVSKIYEMSQRCDSMPISDEVRIEMEKTAQENAKVEQKREETAQLKLQIELKKLEYSYKYDRRVHVENDDMELDEEPLNTEEPPRARSVSVPMQLSVEVQQPATPQLPVQVSIAMKPAMSAEKSVLEWWSTQTIPGEGREANLRCKQDAFQAFCNWADARGYERPETSVSFSLITTKLIENSRISNLKKSHKKTNGTTTTSFAGRKFL